MSSTTRLVLFLKSGPGTGTQIAHKGGYAKYGNPPRWHKIGHDKPAPKGAPVSAHPHAGGQHAPVKHFTDDQWAALKLPDSNVNAGSHNAALEKLKAHSEAGDVTAILGSGFGVNTYGKAQAKIANTLLEMHGSTHKVSPGQKPGWHAAVEAASHVTPAEPAAGDKNGGPASVPAAAEADAMVSPAPSQPVNTTVHKMLGNPAAPVLAMPDFTEGKATTGVKAYYEKLAQKVIDHGKAGNVSVLTDMVAATQGAWQGKTANSKKLLALHAAALAHAGPPTAAEPAAPAPAATETVAPAIALGDDGAPVKPSGEAFSTVLAEIEAAITDGDASTLGDVVNNLQGLNSLGAKTATAYAEAGIRHLKHKKASAVPPAAKAMYDDMAAKGEWSELEQWMHPDTGLKQSVKDYIGGLLAKKPAETGKLSADQLGKLQAIPWFKLKLPVENSNAKSHNAAIEKIEAMAFAGDTDGLLAFIQAKGTPKQTYAKKQVLIASTAVAALNPEPGGAGVSPGGLTDTESKLLEHAIAANSKETLQQLAKVAHNPALKTAATHALSMMASGAVAPAPAATPGGYTQVPKAILTYEGMVITVNVDNKAAAKLLGLPAHALLDTDTTTYTVKDASGNTLNVYKHNGALSVRTSGKNSSHATAQTLAHFLEKNAPVSAPAAPAAAATGLSDHQKGVIDTLAAAGGADNLQAIIDSHANAGEKGNPSVKAYAQKALDRLKTSAAPAEPDWGYSEQDPAMSGAATLTAQSPGGDVIVVAKVPPEAGDGYQLMNLGPDGSAGDNFTDHGSLAEVVDELHASYGMSAPEDLLQKLDPTYKPAGPKEGDTKPGADGLLVLKNGHWVKASPEKHVSPQHQFTNTTGTSNKFWSVHTEGAQMHTHYGKTGTKGSVTVKDFASPAVAHAAMAKIIEAKVKDGYKHANSVGGTALPPGVFALSPGGAKVVTSLTTGWNAKFIEKAKAAAIAGDLPGMYDLYKQCATNSKKTPKTMATLKALAEAMGYELKIGGLGSTPGPTGATAAPAAPAKAYVAPAPEPEVVAPLEAMDGWKQTGPQGGSNPGGRFRDASGVEWYCKFPADEAMARSEVLAAKLYGAAGMAAQDAKLITKGGKVGIASRWVTVAKAANPAALAKTDGARSGFAVDAWLANWDVVGMGYDNLQVGTDGKAVRVDAGGSLEYRAQGAKKPFGAKVDEIDTMRDKKNNPQAASVFGGMTDADITASVAKVAALTEPQIRAVVEQFGPGTKAERKALAETLIARRADLMQRFPKAAKAVKKRLDPTHLPVASAEFPKAHDFSNWNGPGKGLSSKEIVNQSNAFVEQQLLALAQTGNLTALKDFKFQPIDKDTGQPSGAPQPISDHPSKHVSQFQQDLVQILDEIANPPKPLKLFRATDVGSLASLDAAFPPKPFGTTVASVSSNEKMGFWVALGAVANPAKFAPKKTMEFTAAAIANAKAKFADMPALAKHFVKSVQASGSYNDLFRNGKTQDHSGNKLSDVAKAALGSATSQPEGTSLYRWQNMSDEMLKHIMASPDGIVFQATGPMCTSYSPTATSGFGKHRVTIRYAKGAKAVESFGSGSYVGEKEVTTLPNARFLVLSKKMVDSTKSPGSKRLELEILMLPPDIGL